MTADRVPKKCQICGEQTVPAFSSTVMGRHEADFRSCGNCDYLHCYEPHWLNEAYLKPITDADTGLVARNIDFSRKISVLIEKKFDSSANYLDYAGGYGVFTRLMRDTGFQFFHHDIYTENLFAKEYIWDRNISVSGITCFECLEHFENPLLEVTNLARIAPLLIFSTTPLPQSIPDMDWEYYAFDHGQHISFYSPKTIQALARKIELNAISVGSIHILSKALLNAAEVRHLFKRANRVSYPFSRRTLYESIRRKKNKNRDE